MKTTFILESLKYKPHQKAFVHTLYEWDTISNRLEHYGHFASELYVATYSSQPYNVKDLYQKEHFEFPYLIRKEIPFER